MNKCFSCNSEIWPGEGLLYRSHYICDPCCGRIEALLKEKSRLEDIYFQDERYEREPEVPAFEGWRVGQ